MCIYLSTIATLQLLLTAKQLQLVSTLRWRMQAIVLLDKGLHGCLNYLRRYHLWWLEIWHSPLLGVCGPSISADVNPVNNLLCARCFYFCTETSDCFQYSWTIITSIRILLRNSIHSAVENAHTSVQGVPCCSRRTHREAHHLSAKNLVCVAYSFDTSLFELNQVVQ